MRRRPQGASRIKRNKASVVSRSASLFNVVLVTAGNEESAHLLARRLVEARLAACVNIIPHIRSIYHWKGEVIDDSEFLLIIKSRKSDFDAVVRLVQEYHPYEIPEILSFTLTKGSASYLNWLNQETTRKE